MADPTARPDSLFLALRQAYRLGGREYREGLHRHGLTARQATALLAIRRHPGEGVRFLADRIDADLPTCSALVAKLEARGLVERRDDPADRRRTCLYLTAEAEDVARAVARARRAADARIEAAIGADAEPLRALLTHLTERLQSEPVEAAR
jgi:DNA-binding MarR family transcriptional regulator